MTGPSFRLVTYAAFGLLGATVVASSRSAVPPAASGASRASSAGKPSEARVTWPADAMRILHTMLRVNDLDESRRFYVEALGMSVLRERAYPEGKFTLCFLGYGREDEGAVLELTHNWDRSSYTLGDAFGHVAIGTADIRGACDRVRAAGGKVTREPGPMKHGSTVIAFVEDPNGYKIELIERA
jgi:lactoylglutathione lyase